MGSKKCIAFYTKWLCWIFVFFYIWIPCLRTIDVMLLVANYCTNTNTYNVSQVCRVTEYEYIYIYSRCVVCVCSCICVCVCLYAYSMSCSINALNNWYLYLVCLELFSLSLCLSLTLATSLLLRNLESFLVPDNTSIVFSVYIHICIYICIVA